MKSAGPSTGHPIVLVHGLGANGDTWLPMLPGLQAERSIVMVDLPGHGSTPALPGDLTFDRLVDSLEEFLAEQDLSGADLVGSSMGARMVLELARRGVGRHVVALDPGGFWSPTEKTVFATSVKASFALVRALRSQLPALTSSAAGRTALLSQFSARPWALPADVALRDLEAIATTPALFETLQALVDSGPQLGGPTPGQVVLGWGTQDRVTLPRQAFRALKAFPEAKLHPFEQCGHFPMWDAPDEATRLVLDTTA